MPYTPFETDAARTIVCSCGVGLSKKRCSSALLPLTGGPRARSSARRPLTVQWPLPRGLSAKEDT